MIDFTKKSQYTLEDLIEVVRLLRSPEGCPWDKEQTHGSIRRNFLEEVYECCEAIDTDNRDLMVEELGDVLMQVVFHASIEADRGRFTMDEVCHGAVEKLVFRHPNVFGPETDQTWEDMKAQEKGQKTATETLDAVSRALPGLWRAEKLVKKARKAGLRGADDMDAMADLQVRTENLRRSLESGASQADLEEQLGETLFQAAYAASELGLDPEMAMQKACDRYIRRFAVLEQMASVRGETVADMSPIDQISVWEFAKGQEMANKEK